MHAWSAYTVPCPDLGPRQFCILPNKGSLVLTHITCSIFKWHYFESSFLYLRLHDSSLIRLPRSRAWDEDLARQALLTKCCYGWVCNREGTGARKMVSGPVEYILGPVHGVRLSRTETTAQRCLPWNIDVQRATMVGKNKQAHGGDSGGGEASATCEHLTPQLGQGAQA